MAICSLPSSSWKCARILKEFLFEIQWQNQITTTNHCEHEQANHVFPFSHETRWLRLTFHSFHHSNFIFWSVLYFILVCTFLMLHCFCHKKSFCLLSHKQLLRNGLFLLFCSISSTVENLVFYTLHSIMKHVKSRFSLFSQFPHMFLSQNCNVTWARCTYES